MVEHPLLLPKTEFFIQYQASKGLMEKFIHVMKAVDSNTLLDLKLCNLNDFFLLIQEGPDNRDNRLNVIRFEDSKTSNKKTT